MYIYTTLVHYSFQSTHTLNSYKYCTPYSKFDVAQCSSHTVASAVDKHTVAPTLDRSGLINCSILHTHCIYMYMYTSCHWVPSLSPGSSPLSSSSPLPCIWLPATTELVLWSCCCSKEPTSTPRTRGGSRTCPSLRLSSDHISSFTQKCCIPLIHPQSI